MSDNTHDPVWRDLQHRSWHTNPTVPTYNPTNQGPSPLELLHPITIPHSSPHSQLKTAGSFETRRSHSHVSGYDPHLQHTTSDFATRAPVKEMMTKPPSGAPVSAFIGSGLDIVHNIHLHKLFCGQTPLAELSKVDGSNTSLSPSPQLSYESGPSQIHMPAMKRYVVPSTDFNATACNAGFKDMSAGSYGNPLVPSVENLDAKSSHQAPMANYVIARSYKNHTTSAAEMLAFPSILKSAFSPSSNHNPSVASAESVKDLDGRVLRTKLHSSPEKKLAFKVPSGTKEPRLVTQHEVEAYDELIWRGFCEQSQAQPIPAERPNYKEYDLLARLPSNQPKPTTFILIPPALPMAVSSLASNFNQPVTTCHLAKRAAIGRQHKSLSLDAATDLTSQAPSRAENFVVAPLLETSKLVSRSSYCNG